MNWRDARAAGLEAEADRLEQILDELADAEHLLEARRRDTIVTEVRSLVGALRAEASTIRSEARDLRTEPTAPTLPMSITSRHVRVLPPAGGAD